MIPSQDSLLSLKTAVSIFLHPLIQLAISHHNPTLIIQPLRSAYAKGSIWGDENVKQFKLYCWNYLVPRILELQVGDFQCPLRCCYLTQQFIVPKCETMCAEAYFLILRLHNKTYITVKLIIRFLVKVFPFVTKIQTMNFLKYFPEMCCFYKQSWQQNY